MNIRPVVMLCALAATACGERVSAPADEYPVPALEWRIRSSDQLRAIYANSGMRIEDSQRLHGFVGTAPDGRHVIYTTRPRTVDDQVACTLGHEVMHLALGDYHRRTP